MNKLTPNSVPPTVTRYAFILEFDEKVYDCRWEEKPLQDMRAEAHRQLASEHIETFFLRNGNELYLQPHQLKVCLIQVEREGQNP